MVTGVSFSVALDALKAGKRAAREGWNGKNMFVFQRPGITLTAGQVEEISSYPNAVKSFMVSQGRDIEFLPYFCMWSADGKVVNGWLISQTDAQAEDWCILD